MMSLQAIRHLSDEATRKSQVENKRPLVCGEPEDLDVLAGGIPFLGDYVPEGFEPVDDIDDLFVDSSGFGSPGEPALTQAAFIREAKRLVVEHPGCGFGISEAGQFQVYVRVYFPSE